MTAQEVTVPANLRNMYKKHFEVWCSDPVVKESPTLDHAVAIILNSITPLTVTVIVSTGELLNATQQLSARYPQLKTRMRSVMNRNLNTHKRMSEYLQQSIVDINKTYRHRYMYRNPFTSQHYETITDYLLQEDADRSTVKTLVECGRAIQKKEPLKLTLSDYK